MTSAPKVSITQGVTLFNVLALSKYGRVGASSRLRFMQYLPWLQQSGIQVFMQPLLSDAMVTGLYSSGAYSPWSLLGAYFRRMGALLQRRKFDLLWIEKEALPWTPSAFERTFLHRSPYVLDYDDAVFHQYDQHTNRFVRWIFGRRIDALMAGATLVVCGNGYLAKRARDAGAASVVVIPTVIDLERYQLKNYGRSGVSQSFRPCIVWVGSPSTIRYLEVLRVPLAELAREFDFVFRVIGGDEFEMAGVDVEIVKWTEETEAESIRTADIGVMPLVDSAWERGKCGYKLIQYMASGLPVVASHVGVNSEIVVQGHNGFLAKTALDWIAGLRELLTSRQMRERFGLAGRDRVERFYCVQKTAPKLIEDFKLVMSSLLK